VNLQWDAYRFDLIVEEVAAELGNPGLDLLAIRKKNLDNWRQTLATADEAHRDKALRLKIESTLVASIADTLPFTIKEASERLGLSTPEAVAAAMIILRDVRKVAPASAAEVIELVCARVRDEC
jgi:hypothetical protein